MNRYSSTTARICPEPESLENQIEIVYKNGFFGCLFGLSEKKETYVGGGTVWFNKDTGSRAGAFKESEIHAIIARHKSW